MVYTSYLNNSLMEADTEKEKEKKEINFYWNIKCKKNKNHWHAIIHYYKMTVLLFRTFLKLKFELMSVILKGKAFQILGPITLVNFNP